MIRRYIPRNVEELADWYMRYISPLSLIAGFIADNLILLRRVDVWTSNALLFFYLIVAALCIVFLNLIESGRFRYPWSLKILPLLPVIAQFAFGGLFSGYLSLYSRSAAYAFSWIFILCLAVFLFGNERFFRLYRHFSFQIGMFFTVVFSFFIFFLPVVFHTIGPYMFLVSGAVSLMVLSIFVRIIFFFVPERKQERTRIARSVAVIFVIFNILYFTNAIPPLPLALKDAGVYHSVIRTESGYTLTYEPVPWYEAYLNYNTVYHHVPDSPIYVWSAIFAPSGLSTTIFHEWQWYDEAMSDWVTMNMSSYPIVGGRDGGYRGYSAKNDVMAGAWRVRVITRYGQVIGQVSFTVLDVTSEPALVTSTQ